MKTRYLVAAIIIIIPIIWFANTTLADVRVKDIAKINSQNKVSLIGYGLVVGLEGTGDGKGATFTVQSLVNMLERMGVTVPANKVKIKNVAAVAVTAALPPGTKKGSSIDCTVSSLGDATSLKGGTLLMTPMKALDGSIYGYATGPISIGGFNVQVDDENKIVNNYTLVGRIPGGFYTDVGYPMEDFDRRILQLSLTNPDFTTANRLKNRINDLFPGSAYPLDAGTIELMVPDTLQTKSGWVQFVSSIENLTVTPDVPARVVINEKTGTVVAGENVSIAPVALAHGTITISVHSVPVISQPEPFSSGETVETSEKFIDVNDEESRIVYFEERTNISEVASALNAIGATPRDIIAIFQALKQAGALRGELIIL
jgi:flagellar P-ring protein precursor FlgI